MEALEEGAPTFTNEMLQRSTDDVPPVEVLEEGAPTFTNEMLQATMMYPPLKLGDIMWVLKNLTPRGIWPIGHVAEEHAGRIGTTWVVTIMRTAYGTFNCPAIAPVNVYFVNVRNDFCAVQTIRAPREYVAEVAIFSQSLLNKSH